MLKRGMAVVKEVKEPQRQVRLLSSCPGGLTCFFCTTSLIEGEAGDRGWDGWTTSLTQWTWVWANSRRWWRTRKPGMLQFMGLQSWTGLSDWTATIYFTFFISDLSPGLVTGAQYPQTASKCALVVLPHAEISLFEQFLFLMLVEGVPTIRVSGSFVLLGLSGPHFCFQREFWHRAPSDMSGWKVILSQKFCCFISVIYERLVFSANKDNGKFQNLKIIKLLG